MIEPKGGSARDVCVFGMRVYLCAHLDGKRGTWLDRRRMRDLRATLKQSPIVLLLRGDVTLHTLEEALVPIDAELRRGPRGVLMDLRHVTRLHGAARDRLSSWSRAQRSQISGLAVVTTSTAWRVAIRAMSLMGRGKLRAFDEPIRATAWLTQG